MPEIEGCNEARCSSAPTRDCRRAAEIRCTVLAAPSGGQCWRHRVQGRVSCGAQRRSTKTLRRSQRRLTCLFQTKNCRLCPPANRRNQRSRCGPPLGTRLTPASPPAPARTAKAIPTEPNTRAHKRSTGSISVAAVVSWCLFRRHCGADPGWPMPMAGGPREASCWRSAKSRPRRGRPRAPNTVSQCRQIRGLCAKRRRAPSVAAAPSRKEGAGHRGKTRL